MKLFSGLALLVGSEAFDIKEFLAMQQSMNIMKASNAKNPLSTDDMSNYLMQINSVPGANRQSWSKQLSPMNILLGGQSMTGITKESFLKSQKEQMMNQMLASMNGNEFSPMFLQYATGNGVFDKEELLYQSMPEPMATILRLKKNGEPMGNKLLKQYVAIQSFGNDPILPGLFVAGDKEGIKQYMLSKQYETMKSAPGGEFMQTLMYRKITGQAADEVSDKELMAAGMFAGQLDQNGASVKPNDAYLMFKFLKMQTDRNAQKIPAKVILEVALGEDVASIKSEDFQQLFGVTQRDFICVAHENSVRVPCLVNQATVTAAQCPSHCCFNPLQSNGDPQAAGAKVPICYHDLLGKIGAGIARHMINDQNVEALFGAGGLPVLSDLTDARDWGEAQMPEVLRRLDKPEGDFYGNPAGQGSWWSNTYNSQDKEFNIYVTPEPPIKIASKFVPRGPTPLPYTAFVPKSGRFGVAREDPNAPLITVDQIYNAEMSKLKSKLNSASYTCRLISKEHMVNCYGSNYEALKGLDPHTACANKGCCYNEDNLFNDKAVCYRSLRSGYCDPNGEVKSAANEKAHAWWAANPVRLACGDQIGVTRNECLLNPQCCYSENPRISGDSVCYHRGGAESISASGDLSSDAMCSAVNVAVREHCFKTDVKFGAILNKIATREQCEQAGCCYDENAAETNSQMGGLLGGDMDLTGPHCFQKKSEMLDSSNLAPGATITKFFRPSDLIKTCDDSAKAPNPKWPQLLQNEWVKVGDSWSYQETNKRSAAPREKCDATIDMHECIYTLGCCFEKSADPRNPWCYKPRYVKK